MRRCGGGAARRHRNIYRNLIQPGQEQKNCFQARETGRREGEGVVRRGWGGVGWARKESHRSRAAQTQPRPRHPQPLATRPILLSPRPTGHSNFSLPSSSFFLLLARSRHPCFLSLYVYYTRIPLSIILVSKQW